MRTLGKISAMIPAVRMSAYFLSFNVITAIAAAAGIDEKTTAHVLRHTFATSLEIGRVAADATRRGFRNRDAVGVPGFRGLAITA